MVSEPNNEIIKDNEEHRIDIEENNRKFAELKKIEDTEEKAEMTKEVVKKLENEITTVLENNSIKDYVLVLSTPDGKQLGFYGKDEYKAAVLSKVIYKNLRDKILNNISV